MKIELIASSQPCTNSLHHPIVYHTTEDRDRGVGDGGRGQGGRGAGGQGGTCSPNIFKIIKS